MENQQQQQQQSQTVATIARCAICGTTEQLLRCAKCRSIYYCSSSHQHIDWPTHKSECKLLARQKKNNNRMQQLQQAVAATTLDSSSDSNVLGMNYVGAAVTANCSTAQMMSPVDPQQQQQLYHYQEHQQHQQQHQTTENVNWPDMIDNMMAVLPPDFGSESTQITNISNSNYANGLMTNGGGGGVVVAASAVQNQVPDVLQMQSPAILSTVQQQQQQHNPQPHMQLSQQHHQQQQQQVGQSMPPPMLPPSMYHSQNGQSEKSSSYQIGLADDNFIGNANERRYEDLCRNIINDMNQYGLSVVDDFLGMEKGLNILNEVHRMYNAGVFKDGQLVNNIKVNEKDQRTIRGDKITWVKGLEPGCSNVGYLINQIDAVVYRANTMKNNGILGKYNIRERTKAMVACYPGSGSHYVAHVDNPNKDGRVITAIYYLNIDWNASESGGLLRIFPSASNTVADIAPKFDRLIFFWSDKRNPHEVQPAHRTRYAITVWYFDANEREAALNRCKYQANVSTSNSSSSSTNSTAEADRTRTNTAAVLAQAANNANNALMGGTQASNFNNTKQQEADSTTTTTTTTKATAATTSSSSSLSLSSIATLGNRTTNAAMITTSCAPTLATNQSKICT